MRRLSIPLLAVVVLVGGCGGPDSPTARASRSSESSAAAPISTPPATPAPTSSPTPSPTSSPTSSSSQASDPAARRTLRKAQLALLGADTGSVRTLVILGPSSIDTHADYQLTSRSMSSHIALSGDVNGSFTTDAIMIRKDAWFRITRGGDDPKQTCWMTADTEAIESATGVDLPGSGSGIPAGVLVAGNATGLSQLDPSRLLAEIDLYTAAGSFSGKLPIALGLDFHTKDKAPVTITMADGAITGWRLTLFDLLHAVEDAGLELPEQFQDYEAQDLSNAHVVAEFSDLGRDFSVEPPPADLVVQLSSDQEQFAQDRKACDAKIN
jgi:hypothetical protein